MLPHPTLDKLQTLRLHGMLKALNEQLKTPEIDSLSFEERLGLLVDRELTERDDKRLSSRLRQAKLRHNACLEDLDYRSPRGLDKALILQLSSGQWLRDGLRLKQACVTLLQIHTRTYIPTCCLWVLTLRPLGFVYTRTLCQQHLRLLVRKYLFF